MESVTPFAMIGINTNVMAIPECWKKVEPLMRLLILGFSNTIFIILIPNLKEYYSTKYSASG